jgi:hypothetical protein
MGAREYLMFIIPGTVMIVVMSFPEGPIEDEQLEDSHDAIDPAPTDGFLASLRRHLSTWAGRYVEMRVDARTGRRDV